MPIDRDAYFDAVRDPLFGGSMDQGQVTGQNVLLDCWVMAWERYSGDLRWLAYLLATAYWETAQTMLPIEEYGKGSGHSYGEVDVETGQTYYGRGFVQLTWRENYSYATARLGLVGEDDLEWHANRALDPVIAAKVIFAGMREGWYTGRCLDDYFNETKDDPVNARQIVNGNDHDEDIAVIYEMFLSAVADSHQAL